MIDDFFVITPLWGTINISSHDEKKTQSLNKACVKSISDCCTPVALTVKTFSPLKWPECTPNSQPNATCVVF